ncbi:hypothetical protein [Ramlibacter sp.]|uniref:hypothetical protein n=1 Tax=Ramlibacter sp. TaxID=1917967 RepID=UPI002CE91D18|nr:hypothetical protein [Ramlibacter sp.]HWI82460.1 hypothetical protein [Ramlibacter sp.]
MPKVINAFDDHERAQRAVDRLVEAGFSRDEVAIQARPQPYLFPASPSSGAPADHHGQGVLASIGHAMASVFGMDTPDDETQAYLEAVRRGGTVVAVHTMNDDETRRAAAMMRELGAMDIRERARQWRLEGWSGRTLPAQAGRAPAANDEVERMRAADRAMAADQASSERAWGFEGPAGERADKPGGSQR